jgi:hypothetical protein
MSAIRTQIYLTEEQRRRIDAMAAGEGVTMAEVIRRALDAFLAADADSDTALSATFGADPEATGPSRDDWERG